MQCPYNRKTARWVKQSHNDLISEDTGVMSGQEEILVEEYVLMDCLKEQCGVYFNGKCNYNQGGG